jgi:hypothetical protein
MRKLYAGQSVRVGKGGRLKVALSTGVREIAPAETWVRLEAETQLTAEQTKVAQALRRYGVPGGARAIGSSIFSPADGSAMRASAVVIRWRPPASAGKVALRLETESGQRLWTNENVAEIAGVLDSQTARDAMSSYQKTGGQQSLVLIMNTADGETRVTFSLLSKASEQELEKALAGWDRAGDPLLRSIGRAYEFGRRQLLVEAAEEHERALSLAPDSQDLIASAIEAHRRTGNFARTAELRKRLANK